MLTRVISGGQTGADIAGLLAAVSCDIPTGGSCPKGWKTEAGSNLYLSDLGLTETSSSSYTPRTEKNVADSDGTCLFTYVITSTGSVMTARFCRDMRKPYYIPSFKLSREERAHAISEWIVRNSIRVLNVAGNRESVAPGIQEEVYQTLLLVFQQIKDISNENN